jgi:hypothetical protein
MPAGGLRPGWSDRGGRCGMVATRWERPWGSLRDGLRPGGSDRGGRCGMVASRRERPWGSLRDGCDQVGATAGVAAPHGCLRMTSCSTRHRCLVGVREGPGAAQTRREPPRCRLALDRIGRLKRPGHSESIFVEGMHHTCRLTRSPETLPTPAGTSSSCDQLLRPATTKHRITTPTADWSRERKRFIAPRRRKWIAGGRGARGGREGFGAASQATGVMRPLDKYRCAVPGSLGCPLWPRRSRARQRRRGSRPV